jgi:4-amino-4-deoxy-L-arabinose transferase-like glycosyltransferase
MVGIMRPSLQRIPASGGGETAESEGFRRAWSRRTALAVIVSAAVLVIALGLSLQPADPPRNLSTSLGLLDEGIWSHNSVNAASFGDARLDDLNPMYVTSVPPVLMRASYAVFGVGILQTRLPSVVLGAGIVAGIGLLWLRRNPLGGAAASVLLATTYLFLGYARLGLLETTAAALLLAALALFIVAVERHHFVAAFAGGVMLAAAVTSKVQIGGAAAGMLAGLAVWLIVERARGTARLIAAAVGGFMLTTAVWVAYVLIHLDTAVREEWRQHALGIGVRPSQVFRNARRYLMASDGVGSHAGPLLIAAAAAVALHVLAFALRRARPNALEWAAAGWAFAGLGALAAISYQPSRYAVLALPGLALTAAGGVHAAQSLFRGKLRDWVVAVTTGGVAAAAAIGLGQWGAWASHPEWSLHDAGATIRRITKPGDVIGGGFALIPATEAHRRVVTILPLTGINARCPVERFGIDYVLFPPRDTVGKEFLETNYPGLLSPDNEVTSFEIFHHALVLYRVPPTRPASWRCR